VAKRAPREGGAAAPGRLQGVAGLLQGWRERVHYDPDLPLKATAEQVSLRMPVEWGTKHVHGLVSCQALPVSPAAPRKAAVGLPTLSELQPRRPRRPRPCPRARARQILGGFVSVAQDVLSRPGGWRDARPADLAATLLASCVLNFGLVYIFAMTGPPGGGEGAAAGSGTVGGVGGGGAGGGSRPRAAPPAKQQEAAGGGQEVSRGSKAAAARRAARRAARLAQQRAATPEGGGVRRQGVVLLPGQLASQPHKQAGAAKAQPVRPAAAHKKGGGTGSGGRDEDKPSDPWSWEGFVDGDGV
jgi:hypothetical protein